MADNLQYGFGLDFYEGNSVRSWTALTLWDKHPQFAYFRLGIGALPDNLMLLNGAAENTDWELGGYYQMWTPLLPKDTALRTLMGQLHIAGAKLKLPVSFAFEPETDVDRHGKRTTQWPSVGDLQYLSTAVANAGFRTNVYTNLSGLNIIKASRLIDMAKVDWWIAQYYAWPLWTMEWDVEVTLKILLNNYGIPKERVQFVQTCKVGSYPAGASYDKGADYDRAVSWDFGTTPPIPPTPTPVVAITVRSSAPADEVVLDKVLVDGVDATVTSTIHVDPLPITPPPPPPPPPVADLFDVKVRGSEYMKVPPPPVVGSFAQLGGRGQDNWILLGRAEINFIKKWVHNAELWNWAASDRGDIYIARDDNLMTVKWPILVMSSCFGQPRQYVKLEPGSPVNKSGLMCRHVLGIPFQSNGDYSMFSPTTHPWCFAWAPTIYPDNHVGWDSHNGQLFLMPIFQAGTGFRQSGSADSYGGWMDADIFLGPHA